MQAPAAFRRIYNFRTKSRKSFARSSVMQKRSGLRHEANGFCRFTSGESSARMIVLSTELLPSLDLKKIIMAQSTFFLLCLAAKKQKALRLLYSF